jgi:mannosyltransferase
MSTAGEIEQAPPPVAPVGRDGIPRPVLWVAAAATAAGIFVRLWPRSALWLDEAQSVAFARLPLADIPDALRTDGAPPLYYLLLHVWMRLFGDGNLAVRSLSIVCSVALLAVLALAARRLAGRGAAVVVVVLAATNPFAIRYATEGRMYALVALESAIGVVLVESLSRQRDLRAAWPRMAGIAVVVAALLYTHYWSTYLLAAAGVVLGAVALQRRSVEGRTTARRALLAIAAGAVLWLPWVPTFRFQARNTSTPWTRPARLSDSTSVLVDQSGGDRDGARVLAAVLAVGLLVAAARWVMSARADRGRQAPIAMLAGVLVLCPLFAAVGGSISDSAFVARYSSVVFPFLMLVAACGLAAIGPRWVRLGLVATAVVFGLVLSVQESRDARTPAATFSAVLQQQAQPGDVIVYCPDQLGPALSRALAETPLGGLQQGVYPDWASPVRVNWIDYTERYQSGSPATFAREAVARADGHAVWLVWSDDYPATQRACAGLVAALADERPDYTELVADDRSYSDHGALWRFDG